MWLIAALPLPLPVHSMVLGHQTDAVLLVNLPGIMRRLKHRRVQQLVRIVAPFDSSRSRFLLMLSDKLSHGVNLTPELRGAIVAWSRHRSAL
jgi:hypothetical protein